MGQSMTRDAGDRTRERKRVAVVTGASAGVGRAIATAFGARGYRVAAVARGRAGLEGACRDIIAAGGEARAFEADVANPRAVFTVADRVASHWGGVDTWVNAAMETVVGPVDSILPEEYRRVTEVTYLGYVYGTLAALKIMRRCDRGAIIQIGSALAYRAIPLQSAYCAAKFAIRGFTDSLRTELIHDGSRIKLTMIQLPGVNTPQFDWSHMHFAHRHQPIGACYQPEAVAEAVVEVAEADKAQREIWLGLPAIQAIVGAMATPGLADLYLAHSAYEQQISNKPVLPGDPDELLGPDRRDHGARGRFTAVAKDRILALDPFHLRAGVLSACLGLLAGAWFLGRRTGRQSHSPRGS
jgi:NADP-dependent 3-hydroxy acid dehydrogenase YdfG